MGFSVKKTPAIIRKTSQQIEQKMPEKRRGRGRGCWAMGAKKAHFRGLVFVAGGAGENRTPVRECSAQSFYRFSSGFASRSTVSPWTGFLGASPEFVSRLVIQTVTFRQPDGVCHPDTDYQTSTARMW